MNINSFRRRPIKTDRCFGFIRPLLKMTLSSSQCEARDWLSESICIQHRPEWADLGQSIQVILTAEQDSIFDWLSSGLSMIMAAGGHIPPWAKENNESIVCFFFFLRCNLSVLTWKGISVEETIILQINTDVSNLWLPCAKHSQTGSVFKSSDFSTSCTYKWRTHTAYLMSVYRDMHPCPRPFIVCSLLISTFTFPWRQCQITEWWWVLYENLPWLWAPRGFSVHLI